MVQIARLEENSLTMASRLIKLQDIFSYSITRGKSNHVMNVE